jgi:hypothetical protein
VYIIALCSSINTTTFFSLYVHCCPVLDLTGLFCSAELDRAVSGILKARANGNKSSYACVSVSMKYGGGR